MHPRRDTVSIKRGDRFVTAQPVMCSYPGCGTVEHFHSSAHHALPPEFLKKAMVRKGWSGTFKKPLCPTHSVSQRAPKKDVVAAILQDALDANVPIKTHRLPEPPAASGSEIDRFVNRGQTFGPASPPRTIPVPEAPEPVSLKTIIPMQEPEMPATVTNLKAVEVPADAFKKIFREVDANWDENRARYIGDMGDQGIADRLKMPRAWIETVRDEHFGSLNGNDEIEKLKPEIDAVMSEVAKIRDNLVTEASKFDALWRTMKDLKNRLERVEINVLPKR